MSTGVGPGVCSAFVWVLQCWASCRLYSDRYKSRQLETRVQWVDTDLELRDGLDCVLHGLEGIEARIVVFGEPEVRWRGLTLDNLDAYS